MPLDRDIEIPDVLRPGFPASANARQSLDLGLGVLTPTLQTQPTTTIRLIANPFSNANFRYGANKNGTSQLQPLMTTCVFGDDLKAGKRASMDSEGKNETPQLQPFSITSGFCDAGERATMDSVGQLSVLEAEQKKSEQEIRLERGNEAIRKKLEANRARRRSSAAHGGRKSGRISTGRPSLLGKPKPKPSRLRFLSSTKSLVQSVWNRGKAPAPAIASNIPKPVTNVNASTKPAASKAITSPTSLGSKKRSSIASAHPTTASGSRIPFPVDNQSITSNSDLMTLTKLNSIQQPPTGRKPRISRSKVIARLALERAARENGNGLNAACGDSGATLAPRASNDTSRRTQSSLGTKVSRPSCGGGTKSRAGGEERVLLSAKRRVRQSECARRKSKVVKRSTGPVPREMDVDGRAS